MIARATAITLAFVAGASASPRRAPDSVRVGPGTYRPVFPASANEREVTVAAFRLDRTPVTNAAYLEFVRARPEWRRDRVKPLLADTGYLAHWPGPDELGTVRANSPVVRVSWFAARAFCAWRGGRLPLEKEWELAAQADATRRDASADAGFQERIVAWYTEVTPKELPDVGQTQNVWGVSDLHGIVWEWIEDFNAALVTADSREPGRDRFCGGTAATSKDPTACATFMRLAFRSSLEARFTTTSLGFRCAYDEGTTR
jgi:formylglycine-generating enzyme required for sulfatase activity